ncbi:unnamed protein product [Rotaria socialis]|uniref:Uncharacterized protein n=1 Tax=Rotaria socialis TaxID=392032 RepID=A0A821R1J9_9BILA|nr:unnamed protein product [Rotaria socialis]CAF3475499.1 unnamed protein product [Rotaria socialis]CAF3491277.1 unnamed protein product [Rotaria socialis]CAF4463973.1 unnamed protein product [Rotaria socialis]CAF4473324.1 unnamed protein product [Rotaria socialis]
MWDFSTWARPFVNDICSDPFHPIDNRFQLECQTTIKVVLDALTEDGTFELQSSTSTSTNQTSVVVQPITFPMITSQQSIAAIDTDANYLTASILIPSSKSKGSNAFVHKLVKQTQNGNETNLVRKREVHKRIEADRREREKALSEELAKLIHNLIDPKSKNIPLHDLLKIAADLISDINLRRQNDRLRPSNLTNNEYHF